MEINEDSVKLDLDLSLCAIWEDTEIAKWSKVNKLIHLARYPYCLACIIDKMRKDKENVQDKARG